MAIRKGGHFYSKNRSDLPRLLLLSLCCCLLCFSACRKDLIQAKQVVRVETHTKNRLNDILFVNDSLGFCVGGSRFYEADILRTIDGGATWQLYISNDAKKELFGLCIAPSAAIYCIGFEGNLLRSYDQGITWIHRQLRYEAYKAIAFQNATLAQCVGGISFYRGDAMVIDSNGNVLQHDSLGYELNDIKILPSGIGYRCGYGAIQYTNDHGASWHWARLNNDNFTALSITGPQSAFACGGEGSIAQTNDAGHTWNIRRNGNDITHKKYRLRDIFFLNNQEGYAVGEKGVVLYSDDAGRHWSELENFTKSNLQAIAQASNGALFVCGENGELWKILP
ncbi:MAG: hypothetical protein JST36_05320 [Bacteroidetes bacterium]|nr:hypothetical protein [Bacteroidota bacterium]